MEINAERLVLEDYSEMWFNNTEGIRYRVLKGGRETGKSYNFIGLEPIFKILDDERRNIMMIRQNEKDNAQSTFLQLKNAIISLGLLPYFKFTTSPYKITRRGTRQVILFGGMNDVQNITSTTVEKGYWTDIYIEEASQLKSYEDFLIVDGSLRLPKEAEGLTAQITLCMNAWDVGHWTYETFFKGYLDDDVKELEEKRYQFAKYPEFNLGFGFGLALHISSFRCNTHRAPMKDKSMEVMKSKMYDYYLVAGLGCWGALADKTYSHWNEDMIKPSYKVSGYTYNNICVGIDFGMSNGEGKIKYSENRRLGSANTMQLVGVTNNWGDIVVMDEYFDSNEGRNEEERKTSVLIQREMIIKLSKWINEYNIQGILNCFVDCADSGGFIDGLRYTAETMGVYNIKFTPSSKIPILSRVYFENILMAYGALKVSDRCENLIREIKNARRSKEGKPREDFDDHAINAFEYAWIPYRKRLIRWRSFKEMEDR